MLVFRSVAIGLLGACFLLLATRPYVQLTVRAQTPAPLGVVRGAAGALPTRVEAPTIIDVAPGISFLQIAQLLRLAPGEHVTTIDDIAVAGDLAAGIELAALGPRGHAASRHYIDLGVDGPEGPRRILVLMH